MSQAAAEAREQYSLWVVPRGTLGQQLQDEIVHLAGRHPPSPVFHPHVTVLWPLEGTREEVVKVQELAAKVKVCSPDRCNLAGWRSPLRVPNAYLPASHPARQIPMGSVSSGVPYGWRHYRVPHAVLPCCVLALTVRPEIPSEF